MPKASAQESPGESSERPRAKDALLGAAAELIAEVGWGGVRSRMVAERAGVNNALVHYHFGSMENLLRQAAELTINEAFGAPTRTVWREPVAVGMQAAVKWLAGLDIEATPVGVMVESLAQARRDPALRQHAAALLQALRDELARTVETQGGPLAEFGGQGVATLLLATLDGLLLHRAVDPHLDLRPAARSVRALLADGDRRRPRP